MVAQDGVLEDEVHEVIRELVVYEVGQIIEILTLD